MDSKRAVLKEYFGYDNFKEGQEWIIDKILKNKDILAVMPTGAGKSICFQVPALLFDGITIVISPLISLMKDQTSALTQAGIKAAFINSTLSDNEYNNTIDQAKKGVYKIIYVAPERLNSRSFLNTFVNFDISMVTIDEAHCISQWGQDFRPSYTKIIDFINLFKKRPIVSAFTATATSFVREDIIKQLNLKDPEVLVTGFDRKNLYFEVQKPKDKFLTLKNFLTGKRNKSGIIYCLTRKTVEEVCEKLNDNGYHATRYHAGLSDYERHKNQEDFIYDRVSIMVATNAFGMGIDKSNVSFVVHYNMPKDIESYYQEAGRAGRDGEEALCLLLYSAQDVHTNKFLIENTKNESETDDSIRDALMERDKDRLKLMTFYCTTKDCLREYILKYFGEKTKNFCDNCGNCLANFETVDVTIEAQKILSCIYRVKEQYGIKMIIDILRGSKNEKVLAKGFNKLSTYGIMADISETRLKDIVSNLVSLNYINITGDKYPVATLGTSASEILHRQKNIYIKIKKEENLKEESKLVEFDVNEDLMSSLKSLRFSIAKGKNVPAYIIFSDATLKDMCRKMPKNETEFLNVSGVGQVKLERFGKEFLKVIREFC
ncbi:MAG: DNA helicase RecQ [Oscillospiraceae bacterium]|nr:DNA helicase RecQ [Oscillospiraceae bacterium]